MRRLVFLALPPFLKSASDVIGPATVSELQRHKVSAHLHYLGSNWWAKRLRPTETRLGYWIYKFIVNPISLRLLSGVIRKDDIFWMYSVSALWSLSSSHFEESCLHKGAKFVFHLHDDWLSVSGHREAAIKRLQMADLVGAVTKGIQESVLSLDPGQSVFLLRAPIDIHRLSPPKSVLTKNNLPRVIWTGNPSNLKEIPGAMDVLANVYAKVRFDFQIISGSVKPELSLPIPWSWLPYDADKEAERISGAAAGLAPLEDNQYARCKDVFKVKTYMACGVPPIATAVGNNLEVIRDGETGYLVTTSEEWVARLLELLSNPEKAVAMGAAAREDCVRKFSHEAIIPEWIEVLEARFGRIREE